MLKPSSWSATVSPLRTAMVGFSYKRDYNYGHEICGSSSSKWKLGQPIVHVRSSTCFAGAFRNCYTAGASSRQAPNTCSEGGCQGVFTVFHDALARFWISEEPRRWSAWR